MEDRQHITTFKILRLASGKTAKSVASALNLKESSYRRYECSDRLPSVNTLQRLATTYKCSLEAVTHAYNYHKSVRDMKRKSKLRNRLKKKSQINNYGA
ncbi:helix-turn-helix domain-containing protein [Clostridium felsineum]|uniref:Uncharacterized protein n=1 Tax=Clostridium felsineum TaxID=36839 RepID=A0A1S8L029_9CLOT|nr:helix-turn-helix transcriptional regulator [Clostridium felsineum]URZ06424.1 hypothetical protein CLROS_017570 [Clostridium felsineum]URZ11459.1 hypothetical protein CROST_021760 [Clostridium felsineum]